MRIPNTPWTDYVDRVLDKHGLSRRGVRPRTGIPHSTVNSWYDGTPPQMGTVVQFASGLGEDVNEALAAAGYPPVPLPPDLYSPAEHLFGGLIALEERYGVPILRGFHLQGGFSSLTQEEAESVLQSLELLLTEKLGRPNVG